MTAFYMWFSKNPCVVLSPVATSAQCMYRCSLARDESAQWTHDHPGVALFIILVIEMLSQNSHRVSEPSKTTLLSFEDCEELMAKLLANYKCCFFYEWNLICEGWQWVHSLFIASGTGNRSIHRAHQKPQELDAEATGFWTSEQSPIEKLGRLDTSFFDAEPLHCWGGLCVCVWRIMLWLSP